MGQLLMSIYRGWIYDMKHTYIIIVLIKPLLEYTTIVWGPHLEENKKINNAKDERLKQILALDYETPS